MIFKKRVLFLLILIVLTCALTALFFLKMKQNISKDPELLMLIKVMDSVKAQDLWVDIDGVDYKPDEAWSRAIAFLMKRYKKGDTAESWIKVNAYRSNNGNVIYFKYPDGSVKPMRDVFLETLERYRNGEEPTAQLSASSPSSATADSKI